MLVNAETSGNERAGILAVLAGLALCAIVAALPVALMVRRGSCDTRQVENFCDHVAELAGLAVTEDPDKP